MEKVRIITDSGADLQPPFPQCLTVMPLTIHFGSEEFRDGETIDHKTFYERLASDACFPTTSLVPPGEFEAAFRRAQEAGEAVVAVTLSSRLSGTYQSAVMAAQEFEDVYVVDSLNATLGEQILVRYALGLAQGGMAAGQIAAELERIRPHANLIGMPDTLEYLHRGGRISKTAAVLGGALSIRPVLRMVDGAVTMIGKARGSKNGNNYLIQEVNKTGIDFQKPLCLGYTGLSDTLLQRYIADSTQLWEGRIAALPICPVGPTIGTHLGPNAVIVAYFDASAGAL